MASVNDKITDTRNSDRPNSARVSSTRSVGGTTLACNDLTGWPTASKVHGVTYQIDSNSNPIDGTQIDFYGIVSGNSITSFTVVDGTDNGNSVNDVVEMLPTAAWGQDLSDALMASHDRDGTLKDGAVDSASVLASNVVTTAKILDSNVTTDKIADNAVTAAKVDGLDKSLLTTDSNPYKFYAYQTTNQTVSSHVATLANLGTEDFDTNSNLSGGTYTAPVNGFYMFGGRVSTVGSPGLLLGHGASLRKNGSTVLDGVYTFDNNTSWDLMTSTVHTLVSLSAGDTVGLYGLCIMSSGNGFFTAGRDSTNFFGFLVSRT